MPNIGGIVGQKAGEKSQFHINIIHIKKSMLLKSMLLKRKTCTVAWWSEKK